MGADEDEQRALLNPSLISNESSRDIIGAVGESNSALPSQYAEEDEDVPLIPP